MMTLAQELRAQGHDVRFVTFRGRRLGQHVAGHGFDNTEVPVRIKIDPIGIAGMAQTFRRARLDIVHCHLSTSSVNGALAAKLAGIPSISTVHGLSGKLSFAPSTHLIAVSNEVRKHLVAQGVHESKISIVPNGIALPHWTPDARGAARALLGVSDAVPLLGTTARLTRLKGVEHALSAVARVKQDVPGIKYVVFGDGEERDALRARADALGLTKDVVWAGYRDDVQTLLPALDVFLFPSLREAMGISIVEAMAAKVPTIATRIGGIPDVLAKGTGLLVPPADSVALADAITDLLRDPVRRRGMGEAAWERAHEEFSVKRMAARTLEVYAAVIARSKPT